MNIIYSNDGLRATKYIESKSYSLDEISDLSKSAAESAKSAHDTAQTILGTLETVQEYVDAIESNKVAADELAAKALEFIYYKR